MLIRKLTVGNRVSARHRTSESGQALVEFAFVIPMLLVMVTAIFWFAVMLNHYLELTDAVSIGARFLAISRGQTTDPCSTASTAISNAAPLLTPGNITYSIVLNGSSFSGSSCSSSSTTTGAAGDLVQGTSAQVTATYPCTLPFSIFSIGVYKITTPTCTLTAQATELVQ